MVLIGITRQGEWFRYDGDYEEIAADTWHESETFCHPAWLSPNRSVHGMVEIRDNKRIETWLDAVFPVLHGKMEKMELCRGSRTSRDSGYRMWPAVFCIVHGQGQAHQLAEKAGILVPKALVFSEVMEEKELFKTDKRTDIPVVCKTGPSRFFFWNHKSK